MDFCDDYELDISLYELREKPEGNLKDFLKLGSDRLYGIYLSSDERVGNDSDIKKIVNIITEDYKMYLVDQCACDDFEVIDEVIEKGYSKKYTQGLLDIGVLYSYKNKYYIPNDIIKYYNKYVKTNIRYRNCYEDAYLSLMIDIEINGYAKVSNSYFYKCKYLKSLNTKDKNEMDSLFNIVKINNIEYYIFSNCNVDEIKTIVDTNRCNLDLEGRFEYYKRLYYVCGDIFDFIGLSIRKDKLAFIGVVKSIAKRYRSVSDIAKSICEVFDRDDIYDEVKNLIDKIYNDIRYWNYGGLTENEYKIKELYIFPKKVRGKSISAWLKNMNREAISDLYDRFNVRDIDELSEKIVDNAKEYFDSGKCYWETDFIEDFQDDYYEDSMFENDEVLNCMVFLYKDGEDIHMYFPKEIVDMSKELPSIDEIFDNIKYMVKEIAVARELSMQGVVERDEFAQKLIKSGFFESIEDVDSYVLKVNGTIKENLYVTNYALSDIEIGSIYAVKKQCKFVRENDIFNLNVKMERNPENEMQSEMLELLNSEDLTDHDVYTVMGTILYMLHLNAFDEDTFYSMLDDLDVDDELVIDGLLEIIDKYKDIMPVWTYNGYSAREMAFLTAEGDDPCPCGSGKKFKKCCGK